jgi:hypothetical protein
MYDGSTFHMWYSGGSQFTWRIGYATSPDGSTWTKYAGNPVLDWGVAGSWEDTWIGASSVFFDTTYSIFKMWYTGGNGVWDGHIGYATAPKDPVGIKDNDNTYFPEKYSLSQNYPNPFNPLTKIKFILPKQETVKIELYNTLGQKIETLLNKAMKAGHHEIEFNGSHLSSGIYFYQLQAGSDFMETRKMLLMR